MVRAAGAAGLAALGLTDHDTTAGWAQAAAARPDGLALVRGVEISCAAREDVGPPTPLHLLAYLVDPTDPALVDLVATTVAGRRERGDRMVAAIAAAGHPDLGESVSRLAGGTVGRPHVAAALVEAGLVPDLETAFTSPDWLARGGRFHVSVPAPDAERAVRVVIGAGGVPVLAHGWAAARGRTLSGAALARLVAAGLAGVEVATPHHDAAQREVAAGAAAAHGVLVTGATDWHGRPGGPALGAVICSVDVVAAVAARARGVPVLG